MKTYEWVIERGDHGSDIPSFLCQKLPHLSKKAVKRCVDEGRLFINRTRVQRATEVVARGDRVTLYEGERGEIRVVYEDSDLIAISKPPAVPTTVHALSGILSCPIFLVHRLDLDTSGLLLIAKNQKMQKMMEELFRRKEVRKEYLAICIGKIQGTEGTIQTPLYIETRGENKSSFVRTARPKEAGALDAKTEWVRLASSHEATLVRLVPHTGRMHQIRVHLCSIGHPLIGDKKYGVDTILSPLRHMLHACTIEFRHPVTKEQCVISDPIPEDFRHAIHQLFGDVVACGL